MQDGSRVRVATAALVAIGVVRTLGLVFHRPLLGYANNFDFYRIAQWFGLSTERNGAIAAHPASPIATYFVDAPRVPENAFFSSELLFVTPGMLLGRAHGALFGEGSDRFDIRWIGGLRAFALFAVLGAALYVLRSRPVAGLWVAAGFALVLSDPFCTLFFNTLYAEFSALVFAFGALLCLFHLHPGDRFAVPAVLCTALAFLGLGLSKVQQQALPAALLAVAIAFWLPKLRRSRRGLRSVAVLGACAVVPLLVQSRKPGPGLHEAVAMANAVDTWFGAVLPALPDQRAALSELELPGHCERALGKDWYSPGGQPTACPEILRVSRLKAVSLLAGEPRAAMRLLVKAARYSRPWLIESYGHVEDAPYTRAAQATPVLGASLGAPVKALPRTLYSALLFAVMLTPVLFVAIHAARAPSPAPASAFVAALLGTFVLYAFFTSLLGDGFVGFEHHFFLGAVAMIPALTASVVSVASRT